MAHERKTIRLYEIAWLAIFLISLFSILSLIFKVFYPLAVLGVASLSMLILYLIFRPNIQLKDDRFDWIILVILVGALLLRLTPWIYLEGGQDQGVYMTMSKQFETNHSFRFPDNVMNELSDSAKLTYKAEGGWNTLGLSRNKLNHNELFFSFYPLHPALMSVTASVFGDTNRIYSLTLFSILSISGVYLLASEIGRSKKVGYLAAVLLASSPVHLYFSRFPVSEILALAFTIHVLYYTLKGFKENNGWYLLFSLIFANMFMYVRLTWIVSFPFYLLVTVCALLFTKEREMKKYWIIWGVGALISFLLSSAYYFNFIPQLYKQFYPDIFDYIPEKIFYPFMLSLPIITYILVSPLKRFSTVLLTFLYKYRLVVLGLVGLFIVAIGIYNFYSMAFTLKYVGGWFDTFWGMANKGWVILKDMNYTSMFLYLTPVGVFAYIMATWKYKSVEVQFLNIFMLIFLVFNMVVIKFTPYHYYYARYQLSEIIPLVLVIGSIFLIDLLKTHKVWAGVLIGTFVAYNLFFVAFQFQGKVGTDTKMFEKVQNNIEKNDIVIYYDPTSWAKSFVYGPLRYYFNIRGIHTKSYESMMIYVNDLKNKEELETYVLTTSVLSESIFEKVDDLTFTKGFYASVKTDQAPMTVKINDNKLPLCDQYINERYCAGIIPIKYHEASIPLYLYRVK